MKQNLRYSLLMLLLAVFNLGVFAADETIDFSKQGYSNGQEISSVSLTNCTITFDKGTNNNTPKYYSTGTAIRVYGGGHMTVSSTTKTIEEIKLTFGSGDGSNDITTDVITYDDGKGTWKGSASSVKFTVSGSTGQRRIMAVAVTYKAESQSGVAAPTLPESQNFVGSMEVEITNNDNDATVYYTTDGSTPDANSTEYTESFTITETTTVKAIAIKGNDASDVVTRTYTKTKVDIATITGISPTTVNEGDAGTFTLAATFAEGTVAGEDYEVVWETDNYDVLLVDDETGEFIAGEAGTVNVTVTVIAADNDTYNDVTAEFTVTVKVPMTFDTVNLPYEESFAGSFGKFQADGVQVANTNVWTNSSYSGTQFAKATAYISRTPYESQSYLYSPIINLTNESAATLTFEHAISNITFGTDAKLVVRQKDGDLWGDWQELTITGQPTNYTFVEGTVDLSAYAGQQIQLAFVYTSTASSAGTWEIMNLNVSNPSKVDIATINGISPTTVNVEDEGTFELDATFAEGTEAGEDYEVTWTSDNEDVLMVEDGKYLALAAGKANVTVSVTVLDDSKYYEVSETFAVTVTKPLVVSAYELVTDASTLADGDEIIIAYVNTDAYAMGGQANNNRLATGDVTYNTDGTLTIGEDVQQITLEGDAEGYYFNVGDGYLYASSSTKNYMKTEEEPDDNDNAKATIEIDANGDATIVFQGSNTRNHLRFNLNMINGNPNPIFSCYAEGSTVETLPQIYRLKSDVETVTITIGEHGYASYCGDKNLDFSATELKAYAVTQVENGVMILTEFEDGYKAGEGAVLKGAEGEYQVPVATTATAVTDNMLIGNNSDAAITVDADGSTYRFGYSPAAQKVGFMKATDNFTVAPGKAYLKINSTNNAPAFLSFDGTATGIDAANVSTTAADGQRYNLNGQRVNSNYRGVVIVDGKKLIQK